MIYRLINKGCGSNHTTMVQRWVRVWCLWRIFAEMRCEFWFVLIAPSFTDSGPLGWPVSDHYQYTRMFSFLQNNLLLLQWCTTGKRCRSPSCWPYWSILVVLWCIFQVGNFFQTIADRRAVKVAAANSKGPWIWDLRVASERASERARQQRVEYRCTYTILFDDFHRVECRSCCGSDYSTIWL